VCSISIISHQPNRNKSSEKLCMDTAVSLSFHNDFKSSTIGFLFTFVRFRTPQGFVMDTITCAMTLVSELAYGCEHNSTRSRAIRTVKTPIACARYRAILFLSLLSREPSNQTLSLSLREHLTKVSRLQTNESLTLRRATTYRLPGCLFCSIK
jgi:hypothetical protein